LLGNSEGNTIATARWIPLHGGQSATLTTLDVTTLFPLSCTLKNFCAELVTGPASAGHIWTGTITDEAGTALGTPGTISVEFSNGEGAAECDTTNSYAISAAAMATNKWTRTSTPAASIVKTGIVCEVATDGQFVIAMSTDNPYSVTTTEFTQLSDGDGSNSATRIDQSQLANAFNAQAVYVNVSTAPGAAASADAFTFTLYEDTVSQALTCTILEVATTCNDTDDIAIDDNDEVSTEIAPVSTPANASNYRISYMGFIDPGTAAARRILEFD
jgi:hypothetical protein